MADNDNATSILINQGRTTFKVQTLRSALVALNSQNHESSNIGIKDPFNQTWNMDVHSIAIYWICEFLLINNYVKSYWVLVCLADRYILYSS